MNFVNSDAKIRCGGRKTTKISENELIELLFKRAVSVAEDIASLEDLIPEDEDELPEKLSAEEILEDEQYSMAAIISTLMSDDSTVIHDNKYIVGTENVLVAGDGEPENHLMGLRTLSNGLTFYGFKIGADWEIPIFMMLYYDGKSIRLYVPTYGNCVNTDLKCAFGSEIEYEIEDGCKFEKTYRKLGIWIEKSEWDKIPQPLVTMYLNKYGISVNDLKCNWDAIREDIESRIEVK
jgi:hypothetical protein